MVISQMLRSLSIFAVAFRLLIDYLWLDFMNRFRSDAAVRKAEERAYRRWGRLLRKTALRLRGLIIKVGQFLSARADVLPETFTRELASLQDAVPAAPFPAIRKRVELELGAPLESIFAEFDHQALASASLGQVHMARLHEGQTVAVKVLRPGIELLVETDMAALRRILGWLERHTSWGRRFDLQAIADEFETITRQEMDYRQEAENIRRFRKNFAGVNGIDFPFPYDNLVTERLLVMEHKVGMKLTERDRLIAAGLDPKELAGRLVDSYLKQLLFDGFIHVDPHPGNLMVATDGTIVFIDFGMMGTITPQDKQNITVLVTALLTRDLDKAVTALADLGFLRRKANPDVLKKALALILDRLSGVRLQPGPEFDQFLEEFREWMYEEPLQFPAKYLYIGRGVGMLAGLCSGLDPGIDWVKVLKERALPMLEQMRADAAAGDGEEKGFDWRKTLADLFGPAAPTAVDTVLKTASATGLSLVRLPGQLERTLAKIESGTVTVQTDFSALTDRMEYQARMTGRLTWGVLAAGAGVAGSILRTGGLLLESQVAWGIGGVALLFLLINMMTGGPGRGRRRMAPHPTFRRKDR